MHLLIKLQESQEKFVSVEETEKFGYIAAYSYTKGRMSWPGCYQIDNVILASVFACAINFCCLVKNGVEIPEALPVFDKLQSFGVNITFINTIV